MTLETEVVPTQGQMEAQLVQEINQPVYRSKGWLKLLGVLSIVQGVMLALSIVGILVAWLPIWMGVVLFRAATAAETAQETGQKQAMIESLGNLRTYFTINGVIVLVGLLFFLLTICGVIVAILTGVISGTDYFYY